MKNKIVSSAILLLILFSTFVFGQARRLTEADLKGKAAELAPPNVFLKLLLEYDRMFTY